MTKLTPREEQFIDFTAALVIEALAARGIVDRAPPPPSRADADDDKEHDYDRLESQAA